MEMKEIIIFFLKENVKKSNKNVEKIIKCWISFSFKHLQEWDKERTGVNSFERSSEWTSNVSEHLFWTYLQIHWRFDL